jgi:hypothetical protein
VRDEAVEMTGGKVWWLTGLLLLLPDPALAHRDDYIDETFVYQTLDRGEFELEAWAEARVAPDHTSHDWYTTAFEFGVTSRWTLDGAAQALGHDRGLSFGRLRFETRYRFADEGTWPLDLAASVEYEHESRAATGGDVEDVLTPRLVISRDIVPELNTTLNLDLPIRLSGGSDVGFSYALGLRYPGGGLVRGGVELKQQPSERTATVFPQIWFALPDEFTIKIGSGFGLTSETDRFVGRLVFEKEF